MVLLSIFFKSPPPLSLSLSHSLSPSLSHLSPLSFSPSLYPSLSPLSLSALSLRSLSLPLSLYLSLSLSVSLTFSLSIPSCTIDEGPPFQRRRRGGGGGKKCYIIKINYHMTLIVMCLVQDIASYYWLVTK